MRLTTDFPLVPRLRMSGAIYPLPLYAFTARTRKTNFFYAFQLLRKALIRSNVKHEIHTNEIQLQLFLGCPRKCQGLSLLYIVRIHMHYYNVGSSESISLQNVLIHYDAFVIETYLHI